jgi:hypothetical protein
VHQLHFCDKVDFNDAEGIIVLMMSGFERFDFFQQNPLRGTGQDDGYSNGDFAHYKWRTMWPHEGIDSTEKPLWTAYARLLWSEQFVANEAMMALLDAQTFTKAYGFKLVVANGFNQRREPFMEYMRTNCGSLTDKFKWAESYVHNETPYMAFVQKLVEMDGLIPPDQWAGFHEFYHKRNWPAKYLTNCQGAHPTLEGYKVIGQELANFIKLRGYV